MDTNSTVRPTDSSSSTTIIPPSPAAQSPPTSKIYILLQHSLSAGASALLPFSSIKGIYRSRHDAEDHLDRMKDERQPLIRQSSEWKAFAAKVEVSRANCCVSGMASGAAAGSMFWNTAGEEDVGEGQGYRYVAVSGEEFVVWIEEHELR